MQTTMTRRLFDSALLRGAQEGMDFLAGVLEASTEYSIIGKDLDGQILLWNEGARRMYGYDPEEVIGRANASILHTPEDVAAGTPRQMMDAALQAGKWEGVIGRIRKDGRRISARVVVTPRRDAAGTPIGFLLVSKDISDEIRLTEELKATQFYDQNGKLHGVFAAARDVTERKRFEQTLQEKNVELKGANFDKDRFLASMSHELRTPLNAIIGFTGTLLMKLPGPLTTDQDAQLRTIQTSARHLLSLINDLLDLAKIESGKVELHVEDVACGGVVGEVAQTLAPLAQAKGLEFEVQLPPQDVVVRADRRALSQVLINLTNNAIKFTNTGRIELRVARTADNGRSATTISVTDTGVGIRPEDKARLFQAFEQLETTSTRRHEGTGLGLHLSQKLAVLLGGHLTFESEYGRGSTFSIVLPERA